MATKKGYKGKAVPTVYQIEVLVDHAGEFTYRLAGTGEDATTIKPKNGDMVSWCVKWMHVLVPFQIEFETFNPFGFERRVMRSLAGWTAPAQVDLPSYYSGNMVFKYTVSTVNGWSDDPDVEPVRSDGLVIGVAPQVVKLEIIDSRLTLSPNPARYMRGLVEWSWRGGARDDFKLEFTPKVEGWPEGADSRAQRILLPLPYLPESPGRHMYKIVTVNMGLGTTGEIEIV